MYIYWTKYIVRTLPKVVLYHYIDVLAMRYNYLSNVSVTSNAVSKHWPMLASLAGLCCTHNTDYTKTCKLLGVNNLKELRVSRVLNSYRLL